MNVVVPLENDPHQTVQALLPWYARNLLDDADTERVREHLQHCAECRAELDAELPLQALMHASADAPDARGTEAALGRMRAQMKAERKADRTGTGAHWLRWVLSGQSAAIAALLVLLLRPHAEVPAAYVGLSAPATAATSAPTDALIMFRPQATEQQIRDALRRHGASLVGGPTESGAYRLSVTGGAPALTALRSEPIVAVAESLEPGARP